MEGNADSYRQGKHNSRETLMGFGLVFHERKDTNKRECDKIKIKHLK